MYSSLTFKNRDLSGLLGFSMKTNELQNRSEEDGIRVNDCRSEPLWANNIMEFIQDTIFRLINYLEVKGPSIEKKASMFRGRNFSEFSITFNGGAHSDVFKSGYGDNTGTWSGVGPAAV